MKEVRKILGVEFIELHPLRGIEPIVLNGNIVIPQPFCRLEKMFITRAQGKFRQSRQDPTVAINLGAIGGGNRLLLSEMPILLLALPQSLGNGRQLRIGLTGDPLCRSQRVDPAPAHISAPIGEVAQCTRCVVHAVEEVSFRIRRFIQQPVCCSFEPLQ